MASLFEIGKTGVQAYRQALSVTGQNIANINTEGYNKRSADIAEVAGVTGGPTNVSDNAGLGVRVTNVRRSFDSYLSDKTRSSQSEYEMLNDFVSKLSDLENMLPWEREIYVDMLINHIKEENEKRRREGMKK